LKLKAGDARSYHPIVEEALKAFNIRHKVTKLASQNYTLRLYDCPHGKNFRNAGAPPEVCDVFLGLDQGIVKSLNPKLEFALTKHILRGDKYCEYVVRPVKFAEV
jgi:predicted ArsR family transcriptional regulator